MSEVAKKESNKKLSTKQEQFVQGIFAGLSQKDAYRKVYACDKCKDSTVDENACRLAAKPNVAARLKELRDEFKDRNMVTAEKVLQEYSRLGFSDVTDYLDVRTERVLVGRDTETGEPISEITQMVLLKDTDQIPPEKLAAISEIKQAKDGSISFKLHDKGRALDSMARHLGMFVDKHEITGNMSFSITPAPPPDDDDT